MKKVLIAGVSSGSGKTSVTLALMKALTKKGYNVQPYKIGPDFVDTKFHTRVTGNDSRNIDDFLVPDDDTLAYLFDRDTSDKDIGIIEGVMGLYDGLGTDKDAHSTAGMAKKLGLPVILVLNGRSMSTSAAAIIKGFINFDSAVDVEAVIINGVMSDNHFTLIKKAINRYCPGIRVLGYLPFQKEYSLPSRQLGLVPDQEIEGVDQKIAGLANILEKHVDINDLLKVAVEHQASDTNQFWKMIQKENIIPIKLGIALDDAFNFYYSDNLKLLSDVGIRIIPFSPIKDQRLPQVDAIWIGGGYPEEFAVELASNQAIQHQIKQYVLNGKPLFAECGGLMYMGDKLIDKKQNEFKMTGILPGVSTMTERLKQFGYCKAIPQSDCLIGKTGVTVVGHEFHHSVFEPESGKLNPILSISKQRDGEIVKSWTGGYQYQKMFASYLHVHFYQSPEFFVNFLKELGAITK
ncbi:cobyrinate a,c-diamide synthase [Pediococcus claussenii]|uniref:Cobyrinate a,c-diamide synthase n=1 Tax=Pediococcus claussenii (strain ATCC BAA-344 / DSM 14800 / JCM 18046 / KCTC 3811 / LMG 21948 / P06) TaxID=701521 RepID=G8PEL8_PEDCP|nr:cobyrinate a,c-diamide synthase [Pediococcus claussenii]AEV95627.1 cobyrinic acid a,c-diamide synthase [Pediococcus claussenii ATCC BAA-344]ANZ69147.1 cobyrinic acid a,c-diamide synthase [Pediococcus claussenii]ANZ70964.1 cobyrinic acid a,c-diamide synthase [Pediococcus claussenii]KRN20140.1 cbiA protein [Pediococcus claussenii]